MSTKIQITRAKEFEKRNPKAPDAFGSDIVKDGRPIERTIVKSFDKKLSEAIRQGHQWFEAEIGEFRGREEYKVVSAVEGQTASGGEGQTVSGGEGQPHSPTSDKDRMIVAQTCIKAAAEYCAAAGERSVIETAKEFYDWVLETSKTQPVKESYDWVLETSKTQPVQEEEQSPF